MRFKLPGGATRLSLAGQEFAANARGVFTIPDALRGAAERAWPGEIQIVGPHDAPPPISEMAADELVEFILARGRAELGALPVEQLRAIATRAPAAASPETAVQERAEDVGELDEFDKMRRAELFAWLRENGVSAKPAHSDATLREMARQKAERVASALDETEASTASPAAAPAVETPQA
jgi:hypothetical protein